MRKPITDERLAEIRQASKENKSIAKFQQRSLTFSETWVAELLDVVDWLQLEVRQSRDDAWDEVLYATTPEQAARIRARLEGQPATLYPVAVEQAPPLPPDFAAVDMAAPGTSDYSESVKRLQAPVLTIEQALRIVDAIAGEAGQYPAASEDHRVIFVRAAELRDNGAGPHPRECWRQARAEFVLRVANEGGRE
jgi:hypothetical protein